MPCEASAQSTASLRFRTMPPRASEQSPNKVFLGSAGEPACPGYDSTLVSVSQNEGDRVIAEATTAETDGAPLPLAGIGRADALDKASPTLTQRRYPGIDDPRAAPQLDLAL